MPCTLAVQMTLLSTSTTKQHNFQLLLFPRNFSMWPQNLFYFYCNSLIVTLLFCLHLETTLFITAFPHSTNISKPCLVFGFSGSEFCPSPGHYQWHCPQGYLEFAGAKSGRQKKPKLFPAILLPLFHVYFISPHSFWHAKISPRLHRYEVLF